MKELDFWGIIDGIQAEPMDPIAGASKRRAYQCKELTGMLEALPPEEILDFECHFTNAMIRATTVDVREAAALVLEGSSDDAFDYFLFWLILQGREMFDRVTANPDSLIEAMEVGGFPQFEEISYVSADVYEAKTNEEFDPPCDIVSLSQARSASVLADYSPSILKTKFPRLYEAYAEEMGG